MTVFSTASPSVDGVGVASASSDDGSEFSGAVFAATFDTRAESNAGLCVKATPTKSALLTTIVPSSLYPKSIAFASTLNPSRSPSIASWIASDPAVVFEILNVALIDFPSGESSIVKVLPIGRAESCSRFNFTFAGVIDPALNRTLPVDALAAVSNATICPVIVRASESAAVIVNGVFTFI